MPDVLTFEASSHTYRLDGAVVPSVTQLLNKLHSFAGVPEDVLEAARERGTAVHVACQYHDENDLDEEALDLTTRGYLAGWKRFVVDTGVKFTSIEESAAHPLHRFAGKWDRGALIRLENWTLDIKTGASLHWVCGLQLAAYNALRGTPRARRGTVQLAANGTYKFREWKDPTDWPAFVSLITLNNVSEKHRNGND